MVMTDRSYIDTYIKFYSSKNHKVVIDEDSNEPKIIIESWISEYKSYTTYYRTAWFFSTKETVTSMIGMIKYRTKQRAQEAREIEEFKRLESENPIKIKEG